MSKLHKALFWDLTPCICRGCFHCLGEAIPPMLDSAGGSQWASDQYSDFLKRLHVEWTEQDRLQPARLGDITASLSIPKQSSKSVLAEDAQGLLLSASLRVNTNLSDTDQLLSHAAQSQGSSCDTC